MKRLLFNSLLGLYGVLALPMMAVELSGNSYYTVETLVFPDDVPPEVGAIEFNEDGELVVALRRGNILIGKLSDDPSATEWRVFAQGLHNACGIHVINRSEVVVSQMPELTRIVDTDGDGVADLYENLNSEFGVGGNYHEINSLDSDGKGGYYLALGNASYNSPTYYHVRGDYSKMGRRGRNYSAVSWKGWLMHVDQDGKLTPWASGFRMQNGVMLDNDGNLWSGDNQGDWKATTPFYHLKKGNFYGHPSGLVWSSGWDPSKDPLELSLNELKAMKTPAAILLPHDIMNSSASQPIQIPEDSFGPYGGQILLPDANGRRINRLMLEEVDGQYQGACTVWINDNGLRSGNNRVCFSPDNRTLYVGQTSRGWGPIAEGVQRIAWNGKVPFDVLRMVLTRRGFQLDFTQPLPNEKIELKNFKLKSYHYQDTSIYGGEKLDVTEVEIIGLKRVGDRSLELQVPSLKGDGMVYELSVDVKGAKGNALLSQIFCYTINRLKP